MTEHLSSEQLNGYIHHTLTDAEREALDRHLAECAVCRAGLDDHEALQRRIRYELATDLRGVQPSSRLSFKAIAPRVKRTRRLTMFMKRSNLVLSSAITIIVLIAVGIGVYNLLSNQPQPESVTEEAMNEQPAVIATKEVSQAIEEEAQTSEEIVEQPAEPAPENGQPSIELTPGEANPTPGQLKWQVTVEGQVVGSPAIAEGIIYFGTSTSHLYAVEAQSGQDLWTSEIGGPLQQGSDVTVAEGGSTLPAKISIFMLSIVGRVRNYGNSTPEIYIIQ